LPLLVKEWALTGEFGTAELLTEFKAAQWILTEQEGIGIPARDRHKIAEIRESIDQHMQRYYLDNAHKIGILDQFSGIHTHTLAFANKAEAEKATQTIDRAYDNLLNSVYQALSSQSRLKQYLDAITLQPTEDGQLSLDHTAVEEKFRQVFAADPKKGFVDLAEFLAFGGKEHWSTGQDLLLTFANEGQRRDSLRQWSSQLSDEVIHTLPLVHQEGSNGDDQLIGRDALSDGMDILSGQDGNDTLIGGIGNDQLDGGRGDDQLIGGIGDDQLKGGIGNDSYLFATNFGHDVIEDLDPTAKKHDRLIFAEGIDAQQTVFSRKDNDLLLSVQTHGSVTVKNFFLDDATAGYQIEAVHFADGTVISHAEIKALVIQGSDADDKIVGYSSDDVLIGGVGRDEIHGGAGADVIQGGADDDALYGDDGDDSIDGGAGDDFIYSGDGDDVLNGGVGNDELIGGLGNDQYRFNPGFGQDVVVNFNETLDSYDEIVFVAKEGKEAEAVDYGLNAQDFYFKRQNDDLLIAHKNSSDRITVQRYFEQEAAGQYKLERIRFADGQVYDIATVKRLVQQPSAQDDVLYGYQGADVLRGAEGDDALYGGEGDDVLRGEAGADYLEGGAGDDWLEGGQGADSLIGGVGNDRYVYRLGDGNDRIVNADGMGEGQDVLQLLDIAQQEVRAYRENHALFLMLADGAQIQIEDYFAESDVSHNAIEKIEFSDGTWSIEQVKALVQQATEQDDNLYGYDQGEYLQGLGGNDKIVAYGGDDVLEGGAGADFLSGGEGNDTLSGGKDDDTLLGVLEKIPIITTKAMAMTVFILEGVQMFLSYTKLILKISARRVYKML
uniref:calcium-binding protein n=1 Tax=Rappaport israeli TaxID=1839807 RepID=UPI000A848756